MHNKNTLVLVILSLTVSTLTYAGGSGSLDSASTEALSKTQEMLNDPVARQKAIGKDQRGLFVDQHVKSLGGNEQNSDEIYALSADILETITKQANGDPEKMMRLVEQLKNNPSALEAQMTSAQRAKLKGLAERIPAANLPSNQNLPNSGTPFKLK